MDFLSLTWGTQASAAETGSSCRLQRMYTGPPQSGAPPGEPSFHGALQEAFRIEPNAPETQPDPSSEPHTPFSLSSPTQPWSLPLGLYASKAPPPLPKPLAGVEPVAPIGLPTPPSAVKPPAWNGLSPEQVAVPPKAGWLTPGKLSAIVPPVVAPVTVAVQAQAHDGVSRVAYMPEVDARSWVMGSVPKSGIPMESVVVPAQPTEPLANPAVAPRPMTSLAIHQVLVAEPSVGVVNVPESGQAALNQPSSPGLSVSPAQGLSPGTTPGLVAQLMANPSTHAVPGMARLGMGSNLALSSGPGDNFPPVPMPTIVWGPPTTQPQGTALGLSPHSAPQPMPEAPPAHHTAHLPQTWPAVATPLVSALSPEALSDGLAKKGLRGDKVAVLDLSPAGMEAIPAPTLVAEKGLPVETPTIRIELPQAVQGEVLRRVQETLNELLEARRSRTVTIRLHPEELGEVVLKVHTFGSRVDTEVRSNNEHVRHAIVEGRAELARTVESKGLSMGSFSVGHHDAPHSGRQEHQVPMRQEFERIGRLSLDSTLPVASTSAHGNRSERTVDYRI